MKPTYLVVSTNVFKDPPTKGDQHFYVHNYSDSEYTAICMAKDLAERCNDPNDYYVIQHIRTISVVQEKRIVEAWKVPDATDVADILTEPGPA